MGGICVMVLTSLDVGIGQFCSPCIFKLFIYHVVLYGVCLCKYIFDKHSV